MATVAFTGGMRWQHIRTSSFYFSLTCSIYIAKCCISAGGESAWVITAEDRVKHNSQFEQLKPVNGFVTGLCLLK